ncbi:helix-turn-helix domain-containing protein [Iocasia frigidifontis]|uniref:Helix-turn-helix domain-containing protein n=1 Tax=Iocasia fonsfrigidae TaxID=2682810 RepID=A0A8A7K5S8_9FIRM|nr:helix-turn-helix transcriptional regulator [Iocasia fonsfrigidae]QTL96520.1 helix-turn-helix domain-containing protein [Iocasia fonsfrigidae]
MDTSNRLRQLREENNMTQKEVADKLGITRAAVGLYEQGKRNIDNKTLISLAKIFNVSVDYLLGESSERSPADKIKAALSDDPELLSFWDELKEREDLQLMFKQTRDLDPAAIKQIIEIIKTFEKEEEERYNGR